jgi:hypothetical protein
LRTYSGGSSQEPGIHGEAATAAAIDRLGELWDEGKASGPAKLLDFDELRREAHERLKAAKKRTIHR